jgi:pSer/pThr/pTyr-binding forkhead associated (FHA) protein
MGSSRIVLSGLGPKLAGLTWESNRLLRIGRQSNLDVVLRDFSVDRLHAEVKYHGPRWVVRDLADNPLYPTCVNNQVVAGTDRVLQPQDILQVGKLLLKVVEVTNETPDEKPAPDGPAPKTPEASINASGVHMRVQAATHRSWDQALETVALDKESKPQKGQAMLTLLRANHHLSHISNIDELLNSILADTVSALGAQRGSIILADPITGALGLKAVLTPGVPGRPDVKCFSKTLIDRCFQAGESLLSRDVSADNDLLIARSIRYGTMSSIICGLLRSPRRRLGVLHLDRGPLQEPFTESDLYLADAIAASVAVGIETAQLLEQQRDQFVQTVTTLARAVEMRDQYTGKHTQRVTDYSLLLADQLQLPTMERYQLQIGTPLHDIGKIGIDDAILRKPGKLTESEFEFMKTHTTKGAAMLDTLFNLAPMIPIVRHHHERWDGNGYPDRLGREQIPLNARIVGVADAFDAMTSDRPYRPALTTEQAFLELAQKAGSHFDPHCVRAFLQARAKVEILMASDA